MSQQLAIRYLGAAMWGFVSANFIFLLAYFTTSKIVFLHAEWGTCALSVACKLIAIGLERE